MKDALNDHPAVQFGSWLKAKRHESGVVARVFAGRIDLTPAEYAEVESGIVYWIGPKQELRIPILLDLDLYQDGQAEFNHKLRLARECQPLQFSDIFSRDELAPARCNTTDGHQIDEKTRKAIIDAVFKPLPRNM